MTEHDIQLLKSHFTFWDKLSPHQKDILIGGTTAVSYERGDSIHSADLDCVGVLLIKKRLCPGIYPLRRWAGNYSLSAV